jgi:hypothetical protein
LPPEFVPPPIVDPPLTADDFMFALAKFTDEDTAETRKAMRKCVEDLFRRLAT